MNMGIYSTSVTSVLLNSVGTGSDLGLTFLTSPNSQNTFERGAKDKTKGKKCTLNHHCGTVIET